MYVLPITSPARKFVWVFGLSTVVTCGFSAFSQIPLSRSKESQHLGSMFALSAFHGHVGRSRRSSPTVHTETTPSFTSMRPIPHIILWKFLLSPCSGPLSWVPPVFLKSNIAFCADLLSLLWDAMITWQCDHHPLMCDYDL